MRQPALSPQARAGGMRPWQTAAAGLLVLLAACGGDPNEPPPPSPTALAFVTAPAGSVMASALVTPAPVIELRDAQNHAVKKAGVQVTAS
ncbi:MAG TPA: hypothetical protein VF151_07040, partial [Gemmatimonadales bacterium]